MNTMSVALLALVLLFVACLAHLLPYLTDPHALRSYPGPWLAKLSDVWLGRVAAQGHRSEVVHQLHKQYGTFVRLAPNHLSICDPDGIQDVYAHGNGTTKSDFYDAFVSITRGLFNTRSRADHTRKRKVVAHVFSQKSVLEFEPYTRVHVAALFRQWDREAVCGWMLPWFNYLAFDIIGTHSPSTSLGLRAPFGMLQACADTAPTVTYCPAVQIINERGEYSASIGVLPPRWRPWLVRFLLAGMAIAAISKRLAAPTERTDLLSKLQQGKDEEGRPLGAKELTADALTQLIAGSDTTSNSSCAIAYHLAANPDVQEKLQRELDAALGGEDDPVVTFEQVRRLPYLDAVINEGMRVHSTSGIGLPREVPTGGTVLSVPTYTVHRNEDVWGSDADVFRPERWLERDKNELQKAFNPFSFGPRGCIGRNLASMELFIIVASVFRRYHFVLEDTSQKLDTKEGFLRKPVKCRVGVRRRATGIGM
ncbi:cytochrome P450 monooxygenase pc-bph [Fomitopsis serialis]|uniref:cytochrome P450 monooxygenase pc-bph n=1 Tax=Fomitopsis serialis TaxID=139415 RepID=UPI0020080DFE|nr:cytochrome P450 monooxygenase pc-bph [Neoantrodia serialis]KAH9934405.1 cytochrome P450 monooxygenase pc-bph [Neoantrodia serialis]